MPDSYPHLDDASSTRALMLEEIDRDLGSGTLYRGKRLTSAGWEAWPHLLKEAAHEHDSEWLTSAANQPSYWVSEEPYQQRAGKTGVRRVNRDAAARMLAGDEYLRFYLRAICRRAIAEGRQLMVTRLREVARPSPESEAKIGNEVPAEELLADLRENIGIDTFLGIPRGPNSSLGVRFVD